MKIDDILKKCIEIPGISIKSSETSTELLFKSTSGKGSMTFYSLFPGFNLAYIFVNSPIWPAPDFHENGSNATGPLLFNYCVTGRCEIVLNNGNYVYLKDNNLSFTEHFAQSQYQYPRHIYEGLEFFIDLTTIANENTWLLREFGIDFHQIVKHYCPEESTYISPAPAEAETILKKLWELFDLPDSVAVTQMKIYSLALFSYLQNLDHLPPSQACTFFTETQVDIAKQVEKIITSDLRQHHPAWELAARFSVSETSLKNYFRGVYGQNISVYLREIRLKKAAELFASTKLSVSEVAEQVGYMNQSKFAAVFKKQYGQTPLEYRRSIHLKQG